MRISPQTGRALAATATLLALGAGALAWVNAQGVPLAAPTASAAAPASAPASAPLCADCGVVTAVRAERREGQASGLGAVAGGVVGGLVGSRFGKGDGRKALTVAGAVGGGLAGHALEKQHKAHTVQVIEVRLADGRLRRFTQAEALPVGQRVRVQGTALQPLP